MVSDEEMAHAFELMGSRLIGHGTNKSAKCPLAQWTHPKGEDKNPSLTAKSGEVSVYRCWSCGSQGTLRSLAKKYFDYSGDNSAYNYMKQIEGEVVNTWGAVSRSKFGSYYQKIKKVSEPKAKPITESELKEFLKLIPEYAIERGLTKKEIIEYEIGYDEKQQRMIIPIRDFNGTLLGVSGRDVTGVSKPKYKHYPGLHKEKVWYGERWLDQTVKQAHVVEGFMDVWMLRRLGLKNVFASMGTSISIDQIKRISRWAATVTFIPDCDDSKDGFGPGLKFAEESAKKLTAHGVITYIAGVEPNDAYKYNPLRTNKWEISDYMTKPIPEMIGKDPGDINHISFLEKVLSKRCSFKYDKGVFELL